MVLGVKGPKSILSSAIANALAEFFVVDAKQIESNLLSNTKIVLHNVLLRKQVATIPMNSAGQPTVITVTGSVQQVVFSWVWAVGSQKDEKNKDAWVKDSKLTLTGLTFKAQLEYGTGQEEQNTLQSPSSSLESSTPMDSDQKKEVKKQGGFQKFIMNQVQMIIDSLDLHVQDFEFTVEIPPPLTKPNVACASNEQTSIVMLGNEVLITSQGRQRNDASTTASTCQDSTTMTQPPIIQQHATIESLSLSVVAEAKPNNSASALASSKETFLLEPFSYCADVTRSSDQRFSGVTTGLTVIGKPSTQNGAATQDDLSSGGGLVVHFGATQLEALTQVGIMLLPPPDDDDSNIKNSNEVTDQEGAKLQDNTGHGTEKDEKGSPSTKNCAPTSIQDKDEPATSGGNANQGDKAEDPTDTENGNKSHEISESESDQPGSSSSSTSSLNEDTLQNESDNNDTSVTPQDEPQSEAKCTNDKGQEASSENGEAHAYVMPDQSEDVVSAFILPLKSVKFVLDDSATITFPLLVLSYEADGTVMEITADRCKLESVTPQGSNEKGMSFQASGMKVSMRPTFDIVVNEVTQIYVPGVIRLTKPIENPKISKEGMTWSFDIESIEAELLNNDGVDPLEEDADESKTSEAKAPSQDDAKHKEKETIKSIAQKAKVPSKDAAEPHKEQVVEPNTNASSSSEAETVAGDASDESATVPPIKNKTVEHDEPQRGDGNGEQSGTRSAVPCPLILSVNDIKLKNNGKVALLHELDFYVNPNPSKNSTDVAVQLSDFDSHLLQCTKVNAFAILPLDQPDEIRSFTLAATKPRLSAGHSTEDWEKAFHSPTPEKKQRPSRGDNKPPGVIKFPYASISPLNLKVSWQGTGVAIKDTEISVKPFKGGSYTTSKDLINYYVAACLSRVPGFISNADVLGVNVVDGAASTYGAWLGLGMFGTLGGFGGVAAITAVDGVKGAVRAGKASRNVQNGASWKPGDMIRGFVYSAGQATKSGAFKRGKDYRKGDIIDFVVGVTAETGDYLGENKAKLGAATGAGVGMIAGTIVAGPIGGIIGGIVTSAATGKVIEDVGERASKKSAMQKIRDDPATERDKTAVTTKRKVTSSTPSS